jgi:hypothetical protein
MTTHVYDHFLNRLLTLYGEPKTDNLELFFAEYVKALGGATADALGRGCDRLVKSHVYKGWPTVAQCIRAIEDAAPRSRPAPEPPRGREPTEAERQRVAALTAEVRKTIGRGKSAQSVGGLRAFFGMTKPVETPLSDCERREQLAGYIHARQAQMFERDREAIRAQMAALAIPRYAAE